MTSETIVHNCRCGKPAVCKLTIHSNIYARLGEVENSFEYLCEYHKQKAVTLNLRDDICSIHKHQ